VVLGVERVADGFTQPLFVGHAGDGSGRIFVVEKTGRIRLADGTIFLDLGDRVTAPPLFSYEREQGLLGLAFHPRFAANGFFYVHYNDRRGDHVVSRLSVGPDGRGDPKSEKVLLTQRQPETNFNGGMLAFGPDGYLYIGLGTGGASVNLQANAQDLGTLLGKILRIDVDGGDPYAIPPDNPFRRQPGARPEVWAYGLRNPWRFAFDRATGDLYIGGPGEFKREWVHFVPAGTPGGRNFGWPILEGSICWRVATCDRRGLELPVVEYPTYEGGNCVVIGGSIYRGRQYPLLRGAYLYGDFCTGRIWAAARNAAGAWSTTELFRLSGLISSFGEDEAGELYVADIHNGAVYRLVARPR
ncbi:MAG: PQQ-dependent sugar dehydrogenase, partial [Chloroflexi bacterium]|nr:PQQ-dependent sugar dehydrogenase [Chloroflexota bacterium]